MTILSDDVALSRVTAGQRNRGVRVRRALSAVAWRRCHLVCHCSRPWLRRPRLGRARRAAAIASAAKADHRRLRTGVWDAPDRTSAGTRLWPARRPWCRAAPGGIWARLAFSLDAGMGGDQHVVEHELALGRWLGAHRRTAQRVWKMAVSKAVVRVDGGISNSASRCACCSLKRRASSADRQTSMIAAPDRRARRSGSGNPRAAPNEPGRGRSSGGTGPAPGRPARGLPARLSRRIARRDPGPRGGHQA